MDTLLCCGHVFNTWQTTLRGRSLTVDSPENLSSNSQNLFLEEAVKPLTCFVDILDPEKVLYPFDCIALSKVIPHRGRTHANVAS